MIKATPSADNFTFSHHLFSLIEYYYPNAFKREMWLFVSRCGHFECGSQRFDYILLVFFGRRFKYTCVYYNPLSSEEDKQYVVETSRTTSKVTTSCGKRLYFSFESVIYHDDLSNHFTIYHPNGWQISPPPPPPAPIQKTINTESIIGREKGSEVQWGSLKRVFQLKKRVERLKEWINNTGKPKEGKRNRKTQ